MPTYDLLNCGPRRCFTVVASNGTPLLVHNCWLFEPRTSEELPWITYPFQDRVLLQLARHLGEREVAIVKSRCVGATWMLLGLSLWQAQFERNVAVGLVSRDADLVDKTGDPDSLFWKLDFLLSHQPEWLQPEMTRTKFNLVFPTNSTISGAATTGQVFRGGRKTWIIPDEAGALPFAEGYQLYGSIHHATRCIVWNSTPQSKSGIFAERCEHIPPERVIRIHWSEHPVYNKGLYTSKGGELEILDKGEPFAVRYDRLPECMWPDTYPFILDGKIRSPWYDNECATIGIPMIVAQELDLDFSGSETAFYPADLMAEVEQRDVREPFQRGKLLFDPETLEPDRFIPDPQGNLLLWVNLLDGKPPLDIYGAGADLSAGSGATPTCLAVGAMRTCSKVAEVADPTLGPVEAAHYFVAICRWFHGAKLCWESPGPGVEFGKRILQAGYGNIYWRRNEESVSRKMSDTPGWYPSPNNKRVVHERFRRALGREWAERSRETCRECRMYVFVDGSVEHARHRNTVDPSGAKENHGDRTLATALCWFMLEDQGAGIAVERKPEAPHIVPVGSLAHRREEWQKRKETSRW